MRRILSFLGVLVVTTVCALAAQTFPLTVKVYWNPNAASDAVTSYTIALDGGTPITVGIVPTSDPNCTAVQYPQGCIFSPVTIPTSGQHTFSMIAINQWGSSTPTNVTMNINNPGQVVWVKVAK